MAVHSYRTSKLVPWYHQLKERCIAETGRGKRCKYSASHQEKSRPQILVCKIHADILTLQKGFRFKLIKPVRIDLDQEG